MHGCRVSGWIGVDLDGTIAEYKGWKGIDHIGDPIPAMVQRVRDWLSQGRQVKIFTARIAVPPDELPLVIEPIHKWLEAQGLPRLEVTNVKDFGMIELWDDRAVQVIPNTGRRADGK